MVGVNILVIDDEYPTFSNFLEDNLNIIKKTNEIDIDFDFVFCGSISEGKKLIDSQTPFDIILLDLVFKEKAKENKSFELLKYFKEKIPHIPIILFSTITSIEDIKKAGFERIFHPDGFIDKDDSINKEPKDFKIVFDKITMLLRKFGRINTETGILITHGTDTMAWAYAILRYGLYNLRTNVIITGSQLPLEGAFSPSDAIGNMLTSLKLFSLLVPPNILQVFNDGRHIFNKNIIKVKKWSVDAFYGSSMGRIEAEELRIEEDEVYQVAEDKVRLIDTLYFIRCGGTIDSIDRGAGLSADGDYTVQFVKSLQNKHYLNDPNFIPINPKDSSLFNPDDWIKMLEEIGKTGLSEADLRFDWEILSFAVTPFLRSDFYEFMASNLFEKYSGVIIQGYGAGNVNIIGSDKHPNTVKYFTDYAKVFGASELQIQKDYSLVSFLTAVESYNRSNPWDYKFIVMSSQVPIDIYDIDYESGRIPLYYGALPSGELSFPEAQTKLAFILGHKDLIKRASQENDLSYEQLVKSCFLSGVKFNRKSNQKVFLEISEKECECRIVLHKKNVFVKNRFEDGLEAIIQLFKQ